MTRLPANLPPEDENDELKPLSSNPDASMPLMSGFNKGSEEGLGDDIIGLGEPETKMKAHGQSALLVGIITVIAVGALYGMHMLNKNFQAQNNVSNANEAKIETFLTKLSNQQALAENDPLRKENINEFLNDTPEIISMLKSDVSSQQIPIEYVQKNPFNLVGGQQKNTDVSASQADQKRMRALKALQSELKTLTLNSVMGGRVPVAVINNEFYRKGDMIGSFKITEIHHHSQSLMLAAGGEQFNLVME
ncbi:hypothetical protein [Poriferisphaera sp. WC338]|uniref:hypothetical protein n=1 Tax=Poriferisphaera sp. WC338 TaxID=3425129 RepID=UPI003D813C7C